MNEIRASRIQKMVISALFLALALILPFVTGNIKEIGNMLCPMHIPVMLCGFLCGWPWGAAVGFIAPLLRFLLVGMPPMPGCIAMAFELLGYGFATGMLYKLLPKKAGFLYVSLIGSMIFGRLLYGAAMLVIMGIKGNGYTLGAFWTAAVVNSIPGMAAQIILVPLLVMAIKRAKVK